MSNYAARTKIIVQINAKHSQWLTWRYTRKTLRSHQSYRYMFDLTWSSFIYCCEGFCTSNKLWVYSGSHILQWVVWMVFFSQPIPDLKSGLWKTAQSFALLRMKQGAGAAWAVLQCLYWLHPTSTPTTM